MGIFFNYFDNATVYSTLDKTTQTFISCTSASKSIVGIFNQTWYMYGMYVCVFFFLHWIQISDVHCLKQQLLVTLDP